MAITQIVKQEGSLQSLPLKKVGLKRAQEPPHDEDGQTREEINSTLQSVRVNKERRGSDLPRDDLLPGQRDLKAPVRHSLRLVQDPLRR